jgi:hypothetical protein
MGGSCLAARFGCGTFVAGLDPSVPVAQTNLALTIPLLAVPRYHVVSLVVTAFAICAHEVLDTRIYDIKNVVA